MTDRKRRPHHGVAIVAALSTLFIAACSGSDGPADDSSAPTTLTPSVETTTSDTTVIVTSQPDSGATTATTAARPEPVDALASAIDALGVTYDFESEVTTPAGDVVAVSGSRNGEASQFRITVGGVTLDAIAINQDVWLRQDGSDEWLTSTEVPTGDPLEALTSPVELQWAADGAPALDAVYSPSSLGLETGENITVRISIDGDDMQFESVTGATQLVTTLRPSATPAEIQPPTT